MNDIRMRLDEELKITVSRLRALRGPVAAGRQSRMIGSNGLFSHTLEGSRQGGLSMHEQLLDRVSRLSAALDRMSEGGYGLCEACGGPISLARLDVMPEVPTCVSCDDGGGRHGL